MSHFYASIQGNRGKATRQGNKGSGIEGHVRGWTVGALVSCDHENGEDVVRVYATHGSNEDGKQKFMGKIRGVNGELVIEKTMGR